MNSQTKISAGAKTTGFVPFLSVASHPSEVRFGDFKLLSLHAPQYGWKHLTARSPLVHLLQPDYFTVFRISSPGTPIFEENLHLDFGTEEVKFSLITKCMLSEDLEHIKRMDRVIFKLSMDCMLQPFDFISSILVQLDHQEKGRLFYIRKTSILACDEFGMPSIGITTLKDVTALVTTCKPNNVDITFSPDRQDLCHEAHKRINAVQPKRVSITAREKQIVHCLFNGMSSKEIAGALYISKATVDTHRQHILHKWEVTNTAGLMKRAVEEGCI